MKVFNNAMSLELQSFQALGHIFNLLAILWYIEKLVR